MAKKIQLTIAEPCHENWDKMTPVDKGRFCDSCQKQVTDFSNMSDREIAQFFKKPSTGSVCGRFMQDQLDRDIEIPKKRMPWVKYFFQVAIPAFLVSGKVAAQGKVKIFQKDTTVCYEAARITVGRVDAARLKRLRDRTIQGTVTDVDGRPIPGAMILIKGTLTGTVCGEDGKFFINVPDSIRPDIWVISSVGYETRELPVKTMLNPCNNIVLSRGMFLGMIAEVSKKVKTTSAIGKSIGPGAGKNIAAKPMELIPFLTNTSNNQFILFPNPAKAGSEVSIEWKKTEEGYYTIALLSVSGKLVHNKEVWIDADARLLSMYIPMIVAGTYVLRVTNKKSGKADTEKILIQ
jgi:hypothetical protein